MHDPHTRCCRRDSANSTTTLHDHSSANNVGNAKPSIGNGFRRKKSAHLQQEMPSLGAPNTKPRSQTYLTAGQVMVISEAAWKNLHARWSNK